MRDAQHKMSKRHGDPSFEDLLSQGYLTRGRPQLCSAAGLVAPAANWQSRSFSPCRSLIEAFDIAGISKSPAVFDLAKLRWMNGEYIKKLSPEAFFAKAPSPGCARPFQTPSIDLRAVAALIQPRCEVLGDIPEKVAFLQALPAYDNALYIHKKSKTNLENSLESLEAALPVLEGLSDWSNAGLYDAFDRSGKPAGRSKIRSILWPVRVAISGLQSTPGGATELAALLGKDETLRRIRQGIAQLRG